MKLSESESESHQSVTNVGIPYAWHSKKDPLLRFDQRRLSKCSHPSESSSKLKDLKPEKIVNQTVVVLPAAEALFFLTYSEPKENLGRSHRLWFLEGLGGVHASNDDEFQHSCV